MRKSQPTRGQKIGLSLLLLVVLLAAFPFGWRNFIEWYYGRLIHEPNTVQTAPVAIIFGAGLDRRGRLSRVLRDRMDVAIALHQQGKVEKLLVSGDNRSPDYDEPGAMMAYAIEQGVDPTHVQPDFGGRRTYDTCYRAKHIFQVDEAILVTQQFHLPRALFTCRQLGVTAVGVPADSTAYRGARWFELRERWATLRSLWDIILRQPPPVMGDAIPIVSE